MANNNLRIIANNAAQRATISATPMASGMSASSMLSDVASRVCRSTGNSLAISLVWPTTENVGAVHLPWCNFSLSATIRVRGYSDVAGTTQLFDTGVIPACPAPAVKLQGSWTPAAAASAYMYGGGAHAWAWFANTLVRRVDVDLVDLNGLQGYLEVSRIFAGEWWAPQWNADYGPSLSSSSTSSPFRDRAGRRRAPRGTKFRKMSLQLNHMLEADRAAMWSFLEGNGTEVPFIISLYPGDASPSRERAHQMYCFQSASPAMRRPNFAEHAMTLDMETV